MTYRVLWPIFGFFFCFSLMSSDFDYSMTEQGNWSISAIANAKNPGYIALVGIGTLAIVATGVAVAGPILLCHAFSEGIVCDAAGTVTGIIGGASALGGWTGTVYWAKKLYDEVKPHVKRNFFAKLLRSAYDLVNHTGDQRQALRRLEAYIMSTDINYKTTYVLLEDPLRELAEKLILANEAARFSPWSTFFPEDVDVGLGKYRRSMGRPKLNFPKTEWVDADVDQIVFVEARRLLDESDALFNRKTLLEDITRVRALKAKYDQAREQCKEEAQNFLTSINNDRQGLDEVAVALDADESV